MILFQSKFKSKKAKKWFPLQKAFCLFTFEFSYLSFLSLRGLISSTSSTKPYSLASGAVIQ